MSIWDDGLLLVSHSELAAWTRCPRRWFLGIYLRWGNDPATAPVTGNAQLGTRLHLALEAWEGYGLDPLAVLSWQYSKAEEEFPWDSDALAKERDLAMAIMEGFVQWASEEGYDAGYQIVSTERETSVILPFLGPEHGEFRLVARMDAIVKRESDGMLLLRDYKSVGSLSKANGLPRDSQMKTYSMIQALQAKEDPGLPRPDGGQYVMLLRSKRTSRAKGPFYQVAEFRYNRHDLNGTWLRVRRIASEIAAARQQLDAGEDHHIAAYPVPGEYCEWACPFSSICHLLDDGSRWEDALAGQFVKTDPMARYHDTAIQDVLDAFRKEKTGVTG